MIAPLNETRSLQQLLGSISNEGLASLRKHSPSSLSETESDRLRKSLKRAQERAIVLPPVEDPRRRLELEAAGTEEWLRYYLNDKFYLPFSQNQSSIIEAIDYFVDHGGQKAIADTRGGGKTSIVEGCTLKKINDGKIRYPLIVAANGEAASEILSNIKKPIETNDRLLADYPELCIPIRDLAEAPQKASKQTVNGRRTMGAWSKTTVKFPEVWLTWCPRCLSAETIGDLAPGTIWFCLHCTHTFEMWKAPFSGARIKCVGILGKIRGKRDGAQRPDFCLIDDCEDERAAVSKRIRTRIRGIIDNAIAGAAGPDKNISVVFLCTIQNGVCISAEYTDRTLRPTYSGDRFKQVLTWPQTQEAKDHWQKYVTLRQDGKRLGHDPDGNEANAHYVKHQAVMDAGFTVANEFRKKPGELTAQQHIYNVVADNGWAMVFSEYQNEPKEEQSASGIPKAEAIEKRRNGFKRWMVPVQTQAIAAQIDVGQDVLWWKAMAGWGAFGGAVLAYGSWPRQERSYFFKNEADPTITDAFKVAHEGQDADLDAKLFWALGQLTDELVAQPLRTEAGVVHQWGRIGVDSGFETETVYRFCRESRHKALLLPTKGMPQSMKKKAMGSWPVVDGEIRGWHSRIVPPQGRQQMLVEFDANPWKAKYHDRLSLPLGSASAITLFGEHEDNRLDHKMVSAHCVAESRMFVKTPVREGYEYSPKPGEPDNDLLDTGVGCLVLLGFLGLRDGNDSNGKTTTRAPKPRRQRVQQW